MANGRYGVMDAQAQALGGSAAWPRLSGLQIAAMARALGCRALRVATAVQLRRTLSWALRDLPTSSEPLLVEVALA